MLTSSTADLTKLTLAVLSASRPCLSMASPTLLIMSEIIGWLRWKVCGCGQI